MNAIAESAIAVARLHYDPARRELAVLVDTADGLPLAVVACGALPAEVDPLTARRIVDRALLSAGYAVADADAPYAVITTPVFEVTPADAVG